MEPVPPFLIISFFNLLSACSEINSHFNQKKYLRTESYIMPVSRWMAMTAWLYSLIASACFIRTAMVSSIAFTYSTYEISPFHILSHSTSKFAQNEPDCSARNISDGWMLPGDASYKDGNRALFCLLLAHFDFSQFAVFLGCLYFAFVEP